MEKIIPESMVPPWFLMMISGVLLTAIQIIKGTIPERFYRFLPIAAVLLGVVLVGLKGRTMNPPIGWIDAIFIGILTGASASGLYKAGTGIANK